MTDGILLAETQGDPELRQYGSIILDEAHERSLNIDFLIGYLKKLTEIRGDLKLIVYFGTIDAERFSRHFGNAPVIEVIGASLPRGDALPAGRRRLEDTTREEEEQALADAVEELLSRRAKGRTFWYSCPRAEIRDTAEVVRRPASRGGAAFTCMRGFPPRTRTAYSSPGASGAIVLATNVAETSPHGAAHPVRGRYRSCASEAIQLSQQG